MGLSYWGPYVTRGEFTYKERGTDLAPVTASDKAAGDGTVGYTVTDAPGTYKSGLFTVSQLTFDGSAYLDKTLGWVSMRFDPGWTTGVDDPITAYLFNWGTDQGLDEIAIYYKNALGVGSIHIDRFGGGLGNGALDTVSAAPGTPITFLAYWDANIVAMSVNGSTFQVTANTAIPSTDATTAYIGTDFFDATPAQSSIEWFACGASQAMDQPEADKIATLDSPTWGNLESTTFNPTAIFRFTR